jgi:hypothetical protein
MPVSFDPVPFSAIAVDRTIYVGGGAAVYGLKPDGVEERYIADKCSVVDTGNRGGWDNL